MPSEITFYLIAGLTTAFAIAAMTLRRLIHCALCAAGAFAGLAAAYLQLNAEFIGFSQLLVYVGAIAILIVFAVLLTPGDEVRVGARQSSSSWLAGLAVAALVLTVIVRALIASPAFRQGNPPLAAAPVKRIGEELMTHYVLPLEMVGILLTAALIGAVVIAMRDDAPASPLARRRRVGTQEAEKAITPQ